MGQICDAAGFCLGDCADIEDLDKEPEANEKRGGNEGDAEKDDEEDEGANAVARKRDEKRAHDGGDGSAGTKGGDVGEGIAENLREHGNHAACEIEDGEADGAHGVFDFATEGPQVNHVADDVHPAAMHEHRGEQRDETMAVDNANGHDRPSPNEGVAVSQFLKENPHVENNDEGGDDGESAQRTRGIAERDQAAHLHSALAEENTDAVGDGTFDCAYYCHLEA